MTKSSDLIQGTLDLLILKTLAREPIHGWGIAKRIEQLSDDVLSVGQGSLYPALHRLEQQGWISCEFDIKTVNAQIGGDLRLESILARLSIFSGMVATLLGGAAPCGPSCQSRLRVRTPARLSLGELTAVCLPRSDRSGLFSAWRASRLDPVSALRQE